AEAVERPAVEAGPQALLGSQEARVGVLRRAAEAAQGRLTRAIADQRAAQARVEQLTGQLGAGQAEQVALDDQVGAALAALGLAGSEDLDFRKLGPARLRALRAQREALRDSLARAGAALEAADRQAAQHQGERPAELPEGANPEGLAVELEAARKEREAEAQGLDQARADSTLAERDRAARAAAMGRLARAQERARVWLDLHELIGKAEGRHFQQFAQAMNLDRLLARANQHLARLTERYRLRGVRDPVSGVPSLDFVVEDLWQVGATRSPRTLSGGESFLVSLALALGLSDLRTSSMPVETLMLDEGFGTLDPHTLETALAALQQLQAAGRQVGIISHVAALQESIHARVVVEPVGEGRSRVRVELK
ncbi:MAG: SbcC/MukB-like Walker B domain-containing protein, partial [Pseudomonadota bacterium]